MRHFATCDGMEERRQAKCGSSGPFAAQTAASIGSSHGPLPTGEARACAKPSCIWYRAVLGMVLRGLALARRVPLNGGRREGNGSPRGGPHVAAGTSSARRSVMRQRTSVRSFFIHGALAGALGAATMTVLRMVAHRAGWIQAMVPQAVEVWAKNE